MSIVSLNIVHTEVEVMKKTDKQTQIIPRETTIETTETGAMVEIVFTQEDVDHIDIMKTTEVIITMPEIPEDTIS